MNFFCILIYIQLIFLVRCQPSNHYKCMLSVFNIFGFLILRGFARPSRPNSSSLEFRFVLGSLSHRKSKLNHRACRALISFHHLLTVACRSFMIGKLVAEKGNPLAQLSFGHSENGALNFSQGSLLFTSLKHRMVDNHHQAFLLNKLLSVLWGSGLKKSFAKIGIRCNIIEFKLVLSTSCSSAVSSKITLEQVVHSTSISVTFRIKAGYTPQGCFMHLVDCLCFQLFDPKKSIMIFIHLKIE